MPNSQPSTSFSKHKMDPNMESEVTRSPVIHEAAIIGKVPLVSDLLDNGANIESRDSFGKTPLLSAALGLQTETVELLIARKADMSARGNRNRDALLSALSGGAFPGRAQAATEVVKAPLRNGADPNSSGDEGALASERDDLILSRDGTLARPSRADWARYPRARCIFSATRTTNGSWHEQSLQAIDCRCDRTAPDRGSPTLTQDQFSR